jgi:hypothetical protein
VLDPDESMYLTAETLGIGMKKLVGGSGRRRVQMRELVTGKRRTRSIFFLVAGTTRLFCLFASGEKIPFVRDVGRGGGGGLVGGFFGLCA